MHLNRIRVQDFRNVAWAELTFAGRQQFFVGENGQGKTNLLEAASLATALRSFRTHDARDLVRIGAEKAALAWDWVDGGDTTRVVAELRAKAKHLEVDGEVVYRLQDYIGRFPTVVFSSQDQQLIRGGPGLRRRWLDMVLSSTQPAYLSALTRYHRGLEGRNQLLRRAAPDAELEAFTRPMAEAASELVAGREAALAELSASVAAAYASIAPEGDPASMTHASPPRARTPEEWLAYWQGTRDRDRVLGSTQGGPHRDDLALLVQGRAAQDFASEGQQRTLAIALRLAEWDYVRAHRGREPLVLADDVLSELDEYRRRRFWTAVAKAPQVIATGTRLPDAELGQWQVWRVQGGRFTEENP